MANEGITITDGVNQSLQIATNGSLNDLDGVGKYYYDATVTETPSGISVGVVEVVKYEDANGVVFLHQIATGLLNYGDTFLTRFERFIYPNEILEGLRAFGAWIKIKDTYELEGGKGFKS